MRLLSYSFCVPRCPDVKPNPKEDHHPSPIGHWGQNRAPAVLAGPAYLPTSSKRLAWLRVHPKRQRGGASPARAGVGSAANNQLQSPSAEDDVAVVSGTRPDCDRQRRTRTAPGRNRTRASVSVHHRINPTTVILGTHSYFPSFAGELETKNYNLLFQSPNRQSMCRSEVCEKRCDVWTTKRSGRRSDQRCVIDGR